MRRGWYNDSVRHSLAAKGVKTNYLKRKIVRSSARGIEPESIIAKRRQIVKEMDKAKNFKKFAQEAKAIATKKERADLEKIRKMYAEQLIQKRVELRETNKEIEDLKTARRQGMNSGLTDKEDAENRALDAEIRERQQEKTAKVVKNVQENIPDDQIEELEDEAGFPTRAKINTVPNNMKRQAGASQVGARKRKVIISGKQGMTPDDQGVSKADRDAADFIARSKKKKVKKVETETEYPDPRVDFKGNVIDDGKMRDAPGIEVKAKGKAKVSPAPAEDANDAKLKADFPAPTALDEE